MRAERPILLRFLNVLTSLNDFIIKRIVFLFLVKYIASGTLIMGGYLKCLETPEDPSMVSLVGPPVCAISRNHGTENSK
jgi:hypothetical protein